MIEKFVVNKNIKIHTISQDGLNSPLLLMIPGMFGIAEHYIEEFTSLKDYSLISMSARGRGKSSSLSDNYSTMDQASDVIAVIDSLERDDIVIMAHSFGVFLAMTAASVRNARIKGLIFIDKGLICSKISDKWLQYVKDNPPTTSTIEVAQKIFQDSEKIDFRSIFERISIPTLFFKGELLGHHITEEEALELSKIPKTKVISLKNSGHSPEGDDYALFVSEVKKFINSLKTN